MEKLLTEAEVANNYNCKVSGLRRWRRERRGPKFLKLGRLVRYRQGDVEEYLEKSCIITRN